MSHIINAIYENGVFKPLEKVAIKEHEKIKLIIANETAHLPAEECSLAVARHRPRGNFFYGLAEVAGER